MSDAAERWARSGMAHLTGDPHGPPDYSRAGILGAADAAAAPFGVTPDALLAGRAGLTGTMRGGRIAVGGGSRLVRCRDSWCVFTLARQNDLDSVAALLMADGPIADPWDALVAAAPDWDAADLVDRGQMLEIPCAVLGSAEVEAMVVTRTWPTRAPVPIDAELLVVDLSAMWAGPLCGQLLRGLGATVIKVESPNRPDGARSGNPDFFEWMNGGKVQFSSEISGGSAALAGLLDEADVVIEASRPRALEQAGLDASTRSVRPGRVWVRITGYGTSESMRHRVAFGDDAAVAGGLVGIDAAGPVFCGDAIADPLTGLEAAAAVVESLAGGGGEIIDVAMAGVAAKYAAVPTIESGFDAEAVRPARPRIASIPTRVVDSEWIQHLIDVRRDR